MSVQRPPKRRKYDEDPPILPGEGPWTSLSIRLCKTVQEQFGLDSPVFMKVDEVEYITFNCRQCYYLYYLSSILFGVSAKNMTVYHSQLLEYLPDNDPRWEACEFKDEIEAGQFLVVFENDAGQISLLYFTNLQSLSSKNSKSRKSRRKRPNATTLSHRFPTSSHLL